MIYNIGFITVKYLELDLFENFNIIKLTYITILLLNIGESKVIVSNSPPSPQT